MRASVSLARVALASDPLGEDRSKSVELQGREKSGAPRTRTLDTIAGATVFKTASSASRTHSVCEMAPPLGIAPSSHRLTGGPHTLCVERNACAVALTDNAERTPHSRRSGNLLPAGVAPASFRLEDGCLSLLGHGSGMKWSRASVLPRVSPRPKRGGVLSSSRAMLKLAACAGIAPATFRSTGGCSS